MKIISLALTAVGILILLYGLAVSGPYSVLLGLALLAVGSLSFVLFNRKSTGGSIMVSSSKKSRKEVMPGVDKIDLLDIPRSKRTDGYNIVVAGTPMVNIPPEEFFLVNISGVWQPSTSQKIKVANLVVGDIVDIGGITGSIDSIEPYVPPTSASDIDEAIELVKKLPKKVGTPDSVIDLLEELKQRRLGEA